MYGVLNTENISHTYYERNNRSAADVSTRPTASDLTCGDLGSDQQRYWQQQDFLKTDTAVETSGISRGFGFARQPWNVIEMHALKSSIAKRNHS